jgi:hypothetical protein
MKIEGWLLLGSLTFLPGCFGLGLHTGAFVDGMESQRVENDCARGNFHACEVARIRASERAARNAPRPVSSVSWQQLMDDGTHRMQAEQAALTRCFMGPHLVRVDRGSDGTELYGFACPQSHPVVVVCRFGGCRPSR